MTYFSSKSVFFVRGLTGTDKENHSTGWKLITTKIPLKYFIKLHNIIPFFQHISCGTNVQRLHVIPQSRGREPLPYKNSRDNPTPTPTIKCFLCVQISNCNNPATSYKELLNIMHSFPFDTLSTFRCFWLEPAYFTFGYYYFYIVQVKDLNISSALGVWGLIQSCGIVVLILKKGFFFIFFENVVSTPNISLLFIKGETSAILTMNLNKDSKLTRHRLPEECLKSKQQISWHVINLQKQSFKPDTSSLYCRLSVLSYQAETEMILMTSSIVFLQVYWTWCGVFEGSLMVKLLSLCRLYYKEYGIDQFCIDRVMT